MKIPHLLKLFPALLIMLLTINVACARLVLPGLVGDNMVLQRNAHVALWGWADPGETIKINFLNRSYTATADGSGKWLVSLKTAGAGGPYTMDINGATEHLQLKNILLGDVWLCGGQSNMVLGFNNPNVKSRYKDEITRSENDNIRQVLVARTYSAFPAKDCRTTGWKPAGPQTLNNFSAAAYFFAKSLYEKYHVPIGLINSCYGGTVAEAWTSEDGLKELPQFNDNIRFLHDTVALNQQIAAAKKAFDEWDRNSKTGDKGLLSGNPQWTAADYNDGDWKALQEPGFWDKQGYPNTYGVVWLRKEVELPAEIAGQNAVLHLGQLDDADSTYVNGRWVGTSANRDVVRNYKIAADVLKPGKNVITIRIVNFNGTGGVFPSDTLSLQSGASAVSLNGSWKCRPGVVMGVKPALFDAKNLPTALYNAMIAPLIPYTMKGIIWYQGEYNAHKAYEYRRLFPALIKNWRNNFGEGELPFIYQQLPNFQPLADHPVENEWAELREAQLMALSLPKTGMAVGIDIGGEELHPPDKKDVGDRLALSAERLAYGDKSVVASGPLYKSMSMDGNKIILHFETFGSALQSKGGDLKYFAIAGADHKFVWAKAEIKGNTVEVWSDQVQQPVAVRYAWAGNPQGCNLYNAAGLPASPFRTDDWPGLTVHNQ